MDRDLKLSSLERGSLTLELARELNSWNHAKGNPLAGKIGARVVGFLATPFSAAIDAIAHTLLFAGKIGAGVVISPYNFIAENINPKYKAPGDLELCSALIHSARVAEALFRIAFLPLLSLLNPAKAYAFIAHSDAVAEPSLQTPEKRAEQSPINRSDSQNTLEQEKLRLANKVAALEAQLAVLQKQSQKTQEHYKAQLTASKLQLNELKEQKKIAAQRAEQTKMQMLAEKQLLEQQVISLSGTEENKKANVQALLAGQQQALANMHAALEECEKHKKSAQLHNEKYQKAEQSLQEIKEEYQNKCGAQEFEIQELQKQLVEAKAQLQAAAVQQVSQGMIFPQPQIVSVEPSLPQAVVKKGPPPPPANTMAEWSASKKGSSGSKPKIDVSPAQSPQGKGSSTSQSPDFLAELLAKQKSVSSGSKPKIEVMSPAQSPQGKAASASQSPDFLAELLAKQKSVSSGSKPKIEVFPAQPLQVSGNPFVATKDLLTPPTHTSSLEAVEKLETAEMDFLVSSFIKEDPSGEKVDPAPTGEEFSTIARQLQEKKLSILEEIKKGKKEGFKLKSVKDDISQLKPHHAKFLEQYGNHPFLLSKLKQALTDFLETLEYAAPEDKRLEADDHGEEFDLMFKSTLFSFQELQSPEEKQELLLKKIEYFQLVLSELKKYSDKFGQMQKENQESMKSHAAHVHEVEKQKAAEQEQKMREALLQQIEFDITPIESSMIKKTQFGLFLSQKSMSLDDFKTRRNDLIAWCNTGDLSDVHFQKDHKAFLCLLGDWCVSPLNKK